MFSVTLRNYVFRHHKRRLRDDRISLLIAFAFAMLMLAMGEPERTAALAGVAVLGICMASLTIFYCANTPEIVANLRAAASSSRPAILYRPVSRRLATVSVLALGGLFSMPAIGAAVLDRRLQRYIHALPLDHESIDKIRQTLRTADTYRIRLPSATISSLQAALRSTSQASPELSGDAMTAASAAASNSTVDIGLPPDMHGPVFDKLPSARGSRFGFIPIATNTGPDNYLFAGMARKPDVAKMELIDSPLAVESEYGPAVMIVKGLTAKIDGFHLKHVAFQDMKLIYNGGPLLLESVYFLNCRLECKPSDNSWKLIAAIGKRGWVTLLLQ